METKLDEEAVRKAARRLREAGVKAVAVCFLYGFVRTEHEETARRIVAEEFPEAYVCAGHEVAPEFREYERMSTAVVNAYLGPVMQRYIRRLAERLSGLGLSATPHLTQSNGGVIGFEAAARLPVRTVLSGPSTGVVAAQEVGRMADFDNLITFDMGGTSSDVALLQGGQCRLASEAVVHGYPDQGAHARHPHGGGGRRLDRLCGQRRPAQGRTAQRRSRPGSGLLRPGQQRADGHRRQRRAADTEPDLSAGRSHAGPPGPRQGGDRAARRETWKWT